ncbi:MAG: hypothetical protein IJK89_01875 [Clostridia bacterium]|nr:hypothetical protein [Clostridia bacterium]
MKTNAKKHLSVLLCAVMVFGAALPAFAAGQTEVKPTWQNTVESVTPVGDAPCVKIKLSAEGYKIEECKLPQRYDVVFKDGTSVSAQIPAEPSHFAPLACCEYFFDVETPEGPITLYAAAAFSGVGEKKVVFSVGQYVLDGSLGNDGVPVAGSRVYEFPILEEPCEPEVDEGGFLTKILYFFYSIYQKIESWIVYHFGK